MEVRAVSFDVGSTLLYPSPSVAQAFTRVARERGHEVSLADVERRIPAMDAFYERAYRHDGDFWCSEEGSVGIWLAQYRYLCGLVGLEEDAEGMARAVHRVFRRADHWGVYGDVEGCLHALKGAGYALGVVSNWDAGLRELLGGLSLLPYFDVVVSSAAVGCRKPDPAIFELACARLGVSAGECVHVGDRPDADGAGARAAGVRPVVVDRRGEWGGCGFERIASLSRLPGLLSGA